MKRYKQSHMDLHPDGEWVRYSDHCEAMKRIAGEGSTKGEFPCVKQECDGNCRSCYTQPLSLWRAICEEAECIVNNGKRYLMLTEEMCVRLGSAIEDAAPPAAPVEQGLTREDQKRIALDVQVQCSLIPGASFYNAADMAIDAFKANIETLFPPSASPSDTTDYKAMFEDAARDMAAIDAALDIDPEDAGGAGPILSAIEELKASASPAKAEAKSAWCAVCNGNPCALDVHSTSPAALTEESMIEAAKSMTAKYDGDPRQGIKIDVLDAFYAGIEFTRCALGVAAAPQPREWDASATPEKHEGDA